MPVIAARNPRHLYEIEFDEPGWVAALGYLACEPQMAGPEPERLRLWVEPASLGRVRLHEEGAVPRYFASIADLRDHLHARLFLESLAGVRPLLHAACLRWLGKRVLLVGPKASGKSTLSLALALDGFEMEGDENVFVTMAGVVARPRACRVKESSAAVLPALVPFFEKSAFITDFHGRRIYNVAPDLWSPPWRIEAGPVDAVVLLHGNHGGFSSLRTVPSLALTRALMAEVGMAAQGRGAAVAAVARLAATAAGYDLSVGELAGAKACVKAVLAGDLR